MCKMLLLLQMRSQRDVKILLCRCWGTGKFNWAGRESTIQLLYIHPVPSSPSSNFIASALLCSKYNTVGEGPLDDLGTGRTIDRSFLRRNVEYTILCTCTTRVGYDAPTVLCSILLHLGSKQGKERGWRHCPGLQSRLVTACLDDLRFTNCSPMQLIVFSISSRPWTGPPAAIVSHRSSGPRPPCVNRSWARRNGQEKQGTRGQLYEGCGTTSQAVPRGALVLMGIGPAVSFLLLATCTRAAASNAIRDIPTADGYVHRPLTSMGFISGTNREGHRLRFVSILLGRET